MVNSLSIALSLVIFIVLLSKVNIEVRCRHCPKRASEKETAFDEFVKYHRLTRRDRIKASQKLHAIKDAYFKSKRQVKGKGKCMLICIRCSRVFCPITEDEKGVMLEELTKTNALKQLYVERVLLNQNILDTEILSTSDAE
jgi:hypothetical protein